MRTAIVSATIGGTLAVIEGFLLIVLGGLAGLADNPEGDTAAASGYVVLALGAVVLTAAFVTRGRPFLLATTTVLTAAAGFLVENALWLFAAIFLFGAAALALASMRADSRVADRSAGPS
jgi:hypothetical protein